MIVPTGALMHEVWKRYSIDPHMHYDKMGSWLRHVHSLEPAMVEETAKKFNVSLDDLLSGDVEAAIKVICESENPAEETARLIFNPVTALRASIFKEISQQTFDAFKKIGLEGVITSMAGVDMVINTDWLCAAVHHLFSLLGFVEAETKWYGSVEMGPRKLLSDNAVLNTTIMLPYDDYELFSTFTRGLDTVNLIVHHKSLEDVAKSRYFTRTIISNGPLFDNLPVIEWNQLRLKYNVPGRDPAALAFHDGFVIKIDEHRYAHHTRVLLEALTKWIDKPEHAYFFQRAVGITPEAAARKDLIEKSEITEQDYAKWQTGHAIPKYDKTKLAPIQRIPLDSDTSKADVDVTPYLSILNTVNGKRLNDVTVLANLCHLRIPYAEQPRLQHCIGAMHVARILCNRFKITGYDRTKVEVYAATHDWGHLTGSHTTERYFHSKTNFDHEEFAKFLLRKDKAAFEGIVDVEDIIAMFEHKDPLHDIVDGPFGADRIYYLSVDAHEFGNKKDYKTLSILPWLRWVDNQVVVDQYIDAAFEFLNFRSEQYETLYSLPESQVTDSYQRKMLSLAGIKSPFDKIRLKSNGALKVPKQEYFEFWELNDTMFRFYLANHDDRTIREIMRHLLSVYHMSPHASVAVLKNKGYEAAEPVAAVPIYSRLIYANIPPVVEGVEPEKLEAFHNKWKNPDLQDRLEQVIANRIGLPVRHIIVASVPNLKKLDAEYAPVRIGNEIKSLFDWNPEYGKLFRERANKAACLRVAVHPQMYPLAYDYFKKNSFAKIVEEVYGQEK